jgi:beta-glucosidase
MSVRMRFGITPTESGPYRMAGLGFSLARLYVDGRLVSDTEHDTFGAGLGLHGDAGIVDLEAGRSHEIMLEHRPGRQGMQISVVDVRAEPAGSEPAELLAEAERAAGEADVAVVIVGSSAEWESEGADRSSIHLPNGQDQLVERVTAANPRTVVVLNCGAPMLMPWSDDVPAILLAWYPGQEGGEAITDVLLGDADPGGRMPTTWARRERDTPSYLHYPGEAGVVRYGEGLYVGYRWYDARGIEPLIPFGHGGAYTTFDWGEPVVAGGGTALTIDVDVTNTGERRGTDVVQVYVAPGDAPVHRPVKELAGFAKVALEPGATATARIQLKDRSFARWDVATHGWVVDAGSYTVLVAASAAETRHRFEVELA